MKTIVNFLRDESGAAAAEYALILAVVGAAIGAAALLLGGEIRDAVLNAEKNVEAAQGALPVADGYSAPGPGPAPAPGP